MWRGGGWCGGRGGGGGGGGGEGRGGGGGGGGGGLRKLGDGEMGSDGVVSGLNKSISELNLHLNRPWRKGGRDTVCCELEEVGLDGLNQ